MFPFPFSLHRGNRVGWWSKCESSYIQSSKSNTNTFSKTQLLLNYFFPTIYILILFHADTTWRPRITWKLGIPVSESSVTAPSPSTPVCSSVPVAEMEWVSCPVILAHSEAFGTLFNPIYLFYLFFSVGPHRLPNWIPTPEPAWRRPGSSMQSTHLRLSTPSPQELRMHWAVPCMASYCSQMLRLYSSRPSMDSTANMARNMAGVSSTELGSTVSNSTPPRPSKHPCR